MKNNGDIKEKESEALTDDELEAVAGGVIFAPGTASSGKKICKCSIPDILAPINNPTVRYYQISCRRCGGIVPSLPAKQ